MRVAAIYDIHGNLPALEAVLDEIERVGVDHLVVGGDVLPGPMSRACLERLEAARVPTSCLAGNGEREVLMLRRGEIPTTAPEAFHDLLRWVGDELTDDQARRIAGWPERVRMEIPPLGEVLFCHATPRSDTELFTRRTPEAALRPIFEPCGAPLVVCGHTHIPLDRWVGGVRVVNAGSVGMPFCPPGAYWLLLGPDVEPRRTEYDRVAAAERIRGTEYPQAETFASDNVLSAPDEEEMVARFERAAVRAAS